MGGAEHTSPEEMAEVNKAFIACVQAAAAIVRHDVPFTRWRRGMRGRRLLEDFVRGYLPSRRATASDDLLSVLCHIESDDGERFSDDDVVNHMIFLMMAAHDTSTYTLSTMLQYLGQHPEWQERCRAEAVVLAERVGGTPSLADLEGLESIDLVMKECLRLRAPVPVVLRQTVKDTVVLDTRLPAGTYVIVAPQFSHLMEDYWTAPETFDPERFSPERREDKSHRYAWEPFGGGVHKCLGDVLRRRRGEGVPAALPAGLHLVGRPVVRRAAQQPLAAVPEGRSAHRPAAPLTAGRPRCEEIRNHTSRPSRISGRWVRTVSATSSATTARIGVGSRRTCRALEVRGGAAGGAGGRLRPVWPGQVGEDRSELGTGARRPDPVEPLGVLLGW